MSEVKTLSGSTIRYNETRTGSVKVTLDGDYVGSIVRNGMYWHYQPKGRGTRPGECFNTVGQVKYSLEN